MFGAFAVAEHAQSSLDCELPIEFMLLNLNNAFYTCTEEGWKRFQSFSSFPCGRAKRYENDRVDAILSLRFQNASVWTGPQCQTFVGWTQKITRFFLFFSFRFPVLFWMQGRILPAHAHLNNFLVLVIITIIIFSILNLEIKCRGLGPKLGTSNKHWNLVNKESFNNLSNNIPFVRKQKEICTLKECERMTSL